MVMLACGEITPDGKPAAAGLSVLTPEWFLIHAFSLQDPKFPPFIKLTFWNENWITVTHYARIPTMKDKETNLRQWGSFFNRDKNDILLPSPNFPHELLKGFQCCSCEQLGQLHEKQFSGSFLLACCDNHPTTVDWHVCTLCAVATNSTGRFTAEKRKLNGHKKTAKHQKA